MRNNRVILDETFGLWGCEWNAWAPGDLQLVFQWFQCLSCFAAWGTPTFHSRPGYINLLDAINAWQLVHELSQATGLPANSSDIAAGECITSSRCLQKPSQRGFFSGPEWISFHSDYHTGFLFDLRKRVARMDRLSTGVYLALEKTWFENLLLLLCTDWVKMEHELPEFCGLRGLQYLGEGMPSITYFWGFSIHSSLWRALPNQNHPRSHQLYDKFLCRRASKFKSNFATRILSLLHPKIIWILPPTLCSKLLTRSAPPPLPLLLSLTPLHSLQTIPSAILSSTSLFDCISLSTPFDIFF